MRWRGSIDERLIEHLSSRRGTGGWSRLGGVDPVTWALATLRAARPTASSDVPSSDGSASSSARRTPITAPSTRVRRSGSTSSPRPAASCWRPLMAARRRSRARSARAAAHAGGRRRPRSPHAGGARGRARAAAGRPCRLPLPARGSARRPTGLPSSSPASSRRRARSRRRGRSSPARSSLGGRSMGGRMCSMAVAEGLPAAGLVLISYPLHPPGKPEQAADRAPPRPAGPVPVRVRARGTRSGTPEEIEAATADDPRTGHARVDRGRPSRPAGQGRGRRRGGARLARRPR